jgi:hypothetical protein
MMTKRSMFYPNGEFIPYQMPQDFRKSYPLDIILVRKNAR